MAEKIEYVFSTISPWAYVGHAFFVDIARRNQVDILYRPVNLLDIFSQTGGLPLPKRHPTRQNYRWYELQRWREQRNIALNLEPAHWPFNPALLDKTIISAIELGHDPASFIHEAMKAVWSENKDLTNSDTILEIATACNLPARECLDKAATDEIASIYETNTKQAIENGCFGSPTYWLNGEMYFGQDRLEQLESALKNGRAPYKIPEQK